VPPHLPHAFEASSRFSAQVFIEPETRVGRALLARFGRDEIVELPPAEVEEHASALRTLDVSRADEVALRDACDDSSMDSPRSRHVSVIGAAA